MSWVAVDPPRTSPARRAWVGVRPLVLSHSVWGGIALGAALGLLVHGSLAAVIPAGLMVLPPHFRDEVVLDLVDRWTHALGIGLAMLAAAAVGWASGGDLRPVFGWALIAVVASRTLSIAGTAAVAGLSPRRDAERLGTLLAGLVVAAVATAGWSTGRVPPLADGALVASLVALVPGLLRRP